METSYDNFRLKPTSDRMYKNGFNKRSFVPLQDHNPFTLSTSNNADPDLSLTKGELVTVVGDVNTDRSFTREKKGQLEEITLFYRIFCYFLPTMYFIISRLITIPRKSCEAKPKCIIQTLIFFYYLELLPKDEVMRSFDKTFHSLGTEN